MSKLYLRDKLLVDTDKTLQKVLVTQQEYDSIPAENKKDNELYVITDAPNPYTDIVQLEEKLDAHIGENENVNHIPPGGAEGQVLTYLSDGKAQWDYLSNTMAGGVEDLLAYGVEWDVTVADPHLTRIGNMSFHRTLPIQSRLQGCVAQGNRIMYWLDENNWRRKREKVIGTVALGYYISGKITQDSPDWDLYCKRKNVVSAIYSNNNPNWSQCGNYFSILDPNYGIIEYQQVQWSVMVNSVNKRCVAIILKSENVTLEIAKTVLQNHITINPNNNYEMIQNVEIGSTLTGRDGTVRVYCPEFYIKSKSIGNKRQVWISTIKIDETWTYQPALLVDAYRCTYITSSDGLDYLGIFNQPSLISVENIAPELNNSSEEYYDTDIDVFKIKLGKPSTGISRNLGRTYVRNAGSELMSYNQYKNIFYWLYVIEYANFNCQEAYNEELTSEGYRQGGLGPGVTTWDYSSWNNYNTCNPLTPCGYGNEFGNGTGIKAMKILNTTFYIPRWRGFDNPFGDIWTNLDGIIIDADANNHPNNMNYVYTTNNIEEYGDNKEHMSNMKLAGLQIHQEGQIKEFDLGSTAEIIPKSIGGSSTTYKSDYNYVGSKNSELRTLIVGGGADCGANAGLGYFGSAGGVSYSWTAVGFRSVSRFVSFSSQE